MALFGFKKNKVQPEAVTFPAVLEAPAKGSCIPMEQIPDPVFSGGVLGTCCGVNPTEGKVYAPVGGKVVQVADTLHAIGMEAGGMEILIHVGVDTVEMNGDGFSSKLKEGQIVKKGDLLLTMDLDKIKAAGHESTVILAITNTGDFASVETIANGPVQPGDGVMRVSK